MIILNPYWGFLLSQTCKVVADKDPLKGLRFRELGCFRAQQVHRPISCVRVSEFVGFPAFGLGNSSFGVGGLSAFSALLLERRSLHARVH